MSEPQTLGERLKAERERRAISAAQAADSLHLDVWAIDALESGDYARLGPPVYVKGHLRRYADLLRLPSAAILADFDPNAASLARTQQQAGLRMPAEEAAARDFPSGYAATVCAILTVAIALVWWKPWQAHDAGTHGGNGVPAVAGEGGASAVVVPGAAMLEEGRAGAAAATGAGADAGAAPSTADGLAGAAGMPAPGIGTGFPVGAPSAPAAAVPPAASSADLGHAKLKLTFATDSWVDVHDAAGRRVYAGNCRAHSVRTVAGSAPLRVHLGAAGGVQLEVNNRSVVIQPQFIVHNAADFEAGADGVLRAATAHGSPPVATPHG